MGWALRLVGSIAALWSTLPADPNMSHCGSLPPLAGTDNGPAQPNDSPRSTATAQSPLMI